jgi:hypothetical protein
MRTRLLTEHLARDRPRMIQLLNQLGERWNVVVALDRGRHRTEMRDRLAIEVPHLVSHTSSHTGWSCVSMMWLSSWL